MPEEGEYIRVEEDRPKRSKARFAVLGVCFLLSLEATGLLSSNSTNGPLTSLATLLPVPKVRSAALNPPGARFGLRHTVARHRMPSATATLQMLPKSRAMRFTPIVRAAEEAEPESKDEAAAASSDDADTAGETEEAPAAAEEGAEKEGNIDWDEAMKDLKDRAEEVSNTEAEGEPAEVAPAEPMVTKGQYDRLYADFENFRRRSVIEKEELASATKGKVVKELLAVLDNFERAAQSVKTSTEGEEKINNSYQGLYKQMITIFEKQGLEPLDVKGTKFDPSLHEAIMAEDNDEVEDQTILEVFMNGYNFNGKLLRPATVKVATNNKPTTPPEPAPEAASDAESEKAPEPEAS